MGFLLEQLSKADPTVRNCTARTASTAQVAAYRKTMAGPLAKDQSQLGWVGATGHDKPEEDTSANGSMGGNASAQDDTDEIDQIYTLSTLDEKVKQQVEAAGAAYNFKAAGTTPVDPEIVDAVLRLERNAPFLNRLMAKAARKATQDRRPQHARVTQTVWERSVSGMVTDDDSSSASGETSIEKNVTIQRLAKAVADRMKQLRPELNHPGRA